MTQIDVKDFTRAFIESGTLMSLKDDRILVGWGKRKWSATTENHSSAPFFYFPDFFLRNSTPWFQQENWCEIELNELLRELEKMSIPQPSHYEWKNPHREYFQDAFFKLKKAFSLKELAKAVPYVFETCEQPYPVEQKIRSLIRMLKYKSANPAFLYGYWDASEGILGATPELLFRFTQQQGACHLETMACAATCSCNQKKIALMNDPKELHEHHVVVQGMLESLTPFGTVTVGQLKPLELPGLIHLITPITVSMKTKPDFSSIVHALHPTPALGVFPRDKGIIWLEEYQKNLDRKRYGAPVGFLHKEIEESCCYVAIRNVQWSGNQISIGAGCGVVAESLLEKEWAEINLKLKAIKDLLALN